MKFETEGFPYVTVITWCSVTNMGVVSSSSAKIVKYDIYCMNCI